MRRGHFSLTDLPAWCALNDVTFVNVKAADIGGRGYGLIAERDLVNEDDNFELPTLLTVPKELIISAEGVAEYARENKEFRQLLDAAGHRSTRGDILLFLLVQLVLSSPDYEGGHGPSIPWTQYFSLLPAQVPVPTMWTESELSLLRGTSLESAVSAKLSVLTKEFDELRAKVSELPYWDELLSIDEAVTTHDWVLLDALYRSRSLGLPKSGESMVPCLDLVNHSSNPTAYFEENGKGETVLYLRKGYAVSSGSEITIDYGQDKSPAEFLFSYGFIDPDSTAKSLVLPLEPMDDDPLGLAKLHAFGTPPKLRLSENEDGSLQWVGPFVYLMCLNEEDGLRFRVIQETDGSRHLGMFWNETDITAVPQTIQDLIRGHELERIFELRAVTVVLGIIQDQMRQLADGQDEDRIPGLARVEIAQATSRLRTLEAEMLEESLSILEDQRSQLLSDPTVVEYLRLMEHNQDDHNMETDHNEDDFS
ncbi:SET domain-containing protein [Durotheca rogersii]|uniref:SET domain-containing protein n=1 Tax=Durotheca rogersii TaxID=419775 RepID=UPI00221FCF2C|nr:SET domain-containing protein [Durotheca rogersii]KAI5860149.1 SET domain-containing protein [Durotheca rogersii]